MAVDYIWFFMELIVRVIELVVIGTVFVGVIGFMKGGFENKDLQMIFDTLFGIDD